MDNSRHTLRCAVYAFCIKNNKILLLLRQNTGWMDGQYGLPAGHLEKDETILEASEREVYEEVHVKVKPHNVKFTHVMHRHEKNNFEYIDFFFTVTDWEGNPENSESEKATHIKWFDLDKLPENIIPNVKEGINSYKNKVIFSELS